MSSLSSYPTKAFKGSQKFLVRDPATGSFSYVLGSDLVAYITPKLNYVRSETTRLAAENEDYRVGNLVQTTGATSVGDGQAALYLVVAAGEGDFPMLNGNELLVIAGDEFLREQLASNAAGDGTDLIAHTGTPDTVTEAFKKRVTSLPDITSIADLNPAALVDGQQFHMTGWRTGSDVGGGDLYYDSSRPQTDHDGGTVFALGATPPTDFNDPAQIEAYLNAGSGLSGNGCLVRQDTENVSPLSFGSLKDGSDATVSVSAYLAYVKAKSSDHAAIHFPQGDYGVLVGAGATFFNLVNYKSVSFRVSGARIHDLTSYASSEQSEMFRFTGCKSVSSDATLHVVGERTVTNQGDDRGTNVVVTVNCANVHIDVASIGNRSPINVLDAVRPHDEYCQNVIVNAYSEFNHYGGSILNASNVVANLWSKSPYRAGFVRGIVNGEVNITTFGQVGATLVKAYSVNEIMQNAIVRFSLEGGEPYVDGVIAPISIEIDSADPIKMQNVEVNLNVKGSTVGANEYLTLFSVNQFDGLGSSSSADFGHVFDSIVISGNVDTTGSTARIFDVPRLGTIANNTLRNFRFVNFIGEGGGTYNLDLPASFDHCELNGYPVHRRNDDNEITLTKTLTGDLTGSTQVINVKGRAQALCILDYQVHSDASLTTLTRGQIAFFLSVTPSGSISVLLENEVYKSFNNTESTITISGTAGTNEAFIEVAASVYNDPAASGVFKFRILDKLDASSGGLLSFLARTI